MIIDSQTQYSVVSWARNTNINPGETVCISGAVGGYDCGTITDPPSITIPNVGYIDLSNGTEHFKSVGHMTCASGLQAFDGDSGAPIFYDIGQGQAMAAGIVSLRTSDGRTCFDSIGHVNTSTEGHIWNIPGV